MKRLIIVLVGLLELSCQSLSVDEMQKGKLSFYLDFPQGEVVAKGVDEAPDTNSFYLSVVSSSGRVSSSRYLDVSVQAVPPAYL